MEWLNNNKSFDEFQGKVLLIIEFSIFNEIIKSTKTGDPLSQRKNDLK